MERYCERRSDGRLVCYLKVLPFEMKSLSLGRVIGRSTQRQEYGGMEKVPFIC